MEEMNDGEPIPLLLLRVGKAFLAEGKAEIGITAIKASLPYSYPQLKNVEHSGEINNPQALQLIIEENKVAPRLAPATE
jgi:hypothetical protein